jgi:hypothetical protein
MPAYVDDAAIVWKGKARFHMSADSIVELHAFAASIGVRPCWFHRKSRYPHYDITGEQRATAVAAGAFAVSQKEMVEIAKKLRVVPKSVAIQAKMF